MTASSAETFWHPVRMRVLVALSGRRLTTQQLRSVLPDVAQATLYRHLSRLVRAGSIFVVEQRSVRGVMEKVYALSEDGSVLQPDVSRMKPDDWRRAFAAFTATLMGQFEAYIGQEGADLLTDGAGFRTFPLHLSDAELAQFRADLRAIFTPILAHGPSPERRRRLFSTALIPDVDVSDMSIEKVDLEETGGFS